VFSKNSNPMSEEGGGGHEPEAKEGCQPKQASAFRKNMNIILKDKPCRVVEMSTSKTGKHGHAKVNFTGIDIFTGKKYKEIQGSTHPMLTFDSSKSEWGVMGIEEDRLSLIDEKGNTRDDISLPKEDEEMAKGIKDAFEAGEKEVFVTVLTALKQDMVTGFTLKEFEDGAGKA
jgi:translation initiation factor 5A